MDIFEAKEVTDELHEAIDRLVRQLSTSSRPPDRKMLADIIASTGSILLVARATEPPNEIAGCLTLVLYRIPTGIRARIEDVVVERQFRGRGVGESLSRYALKYAANAGAKTLDLTSRPSREAANQLYSKLGFELRDSNVYRCTILLDDETVPAA